MAKLRKARAYRRLKRPNTRISKYKKKSYVRGVPGIRIVRYDMGALSSTFPLEVQLFSEKDINLRHNAIESARMTANRFLSKNLGEKGYILKINVVPHHIMRENALATGAGADRFQTGMSGAFGKPIGRSAQVKKGKVLFTAKIPEGKFKVAKEAFRKAACKLPIKCGVRTKKS